MKLLYTSSLLLFLSIGSAFCQQKRNVIQQAMKDELDRSMKELSYKNYEKPFFIAYSISDIKSYSAFASLGALVNTAEIPFRGKNVRILVGDYNFNDESLDNTGQNNQNENEIPLPLDDDYFGIRRSLWISTDAIYKSAARQLQQNKRTVEEQKGKTLEQIPHRSFAKTEPATIQDEVKHHDFDKQKMDGYAREISNVFRKHPKVFNSGVILSELQGTKYFENSEGTSIKIGTKLVFLQVSCQSKTDQGEIIYDQLNKYATSFEELPTLNKMKEEVELFIQEFQNIAQSKSLTEEYTGPVLFLGEAVPSLFNKLLLSSNEGLYASNMIEDQSKGIRYEGGNNLDSKVGKVILPESFTVQCLPHLKEYEGKKLLGGFEADDEGLIPTKELVVIEKGILKALFHDRTSLNDGQIPNGYGDGPGIVKISYKNGKTAAALKQQLISKAKSEGLEFAFIVRESGMRGMGLANVYQVSLKDGKETLIRSALVEEITLKKLRKTLSGSTDNFVHHVHKNTMGGPGIMSFITPNGLLVDDIEIKPTSSFFHKDEEFVKSPLVE